MTIHIIYTSGKVGSTTMLETVRSMFPHDTVYTVRRLTPSGIREHRAFRPIVSDDEAAAAHLRREPHVKVHFVTLIREPVSAAISSFFYNAGVTHPHLDLNAIGTERVVQQITLGAGSSTPTFHTDWFDVEFREFTGVDVYSKPWDSTRGYSIFAASGRRSLVLRLEDLDRVAPSALADFYGLNEHPALAERANTGVTRPYADAYRRFLDQARLPTSWIARLYETKYARHFYSRSELNTFSSRWSLTGRGDD